MRAGPLRVLLVSTYELGHQPLALASAAASLRAAGIEPRCLDLAVQEPDPELVRGAELVAISIPMHTAARLGIAFARRLRRTNPNTRIAFFGLYAGPMRDILMAEDIADAVIDGDPEPGLVALCERLLDGAALEAPAPTPQQPLFARRRHPVPDRAGLPPIERYAHARDGETLRPAGYVEASHGCAHRCTHCPLTPVFGGRLRLVEAETVLTDAEQQIAAGARHLTFGDADFFNAVPHSLRIVEELHQRHPDVTFDATIKVEHLLEHATVLPRLRQAGCLFITSAFESCNDGVLGHLQKGHTRADLERVVELAARERLVLRPTWVAFTPWSSAEDFVELLRFVEEHGLVAHVQPVQYTLKLLLPPGSPLIAVLANEGLLGGFDAEGLTYTWTNPDPRIAPLQAEVARIVEDAVSCDCGNAAEGSVEIFAAVKRAALRAITGKDAPAPVAPQPAIQVPGLTEAWFCCAEPTQSQLISLGSLG